MIARRGEAEMSSVKPLKQQGYSEKTRIDMKSGLPGCALR